MMKVQAIAVTFEPTKKVGRLQIVIGAPVQCFSLEAAEAHGFVLSEDGATWNRELTDEMIEREIARTQWLKGPGEPARWRRVELSDFPTEDHDFRGDWRDDGEKITVDLEAAKERQNARRLAIQLGTPIDQVTKRALQSEPDVRGKPLHNDIKNAKTLHELRRVK
jgi:hypothetical protein